mgnify:FL=1
MSGAGEKSGRASKIDGQDLLGDIGIDEAEMRWRKEYTGFDAKDAERLGEMSGLFDAVSDDLVEQFYSHLQRHDETVAFLEKSSRPTDQLKASQARYLRDLGRGAYDESYFQERARIGKIHDLLDLGPKIYLGAYALYYEGILQAIAKDVVAAHDGGGDAVELAVEETVERAMSVLRLVNLDQQVAMDTYIHSYNEKIERELERRAEATGQIEESASELHGSASGVADGTREITDLADEQSDDMGSIASEVSSLSATVEEVAASAEEVKRESREAEELAVDGQGSAQDAIEVMTDIEDASEQVSTDMDDLQTTANEITEVVDVINAIADQTNLLALNANIEAARGRGR